MCTDKPLYEVPLSCIYTDSEFDQLYLPYRYALLNAAIHFTPFISTQDST